MESGAPLNDGGRVSSVLTHLYQKTERNLGPKGIESLCVWLLRPWKPISMPDHFIEYIVQVQQKNCSVLEGNVGNNNMICAVLQVIDGVCVYIICALENCQVLISIL